MWEKIGIINNALSASFLQEMTAVQEAYDLWKTGNKMNDLENESIPSNGVITTDFLYSHDRLFGEIAYYRRWQENEEIPKISLELEADSFNGEFAGDLYGIGNKVLDLYYLDLEKIDYKSNHKYIIDAQNGIIYQVEGIGIRGVNNIHSLLMYRSLTSGKTEIPVFADLLESDGPAGGKKLAGLTDKSDPDYENGFQIIVSASNDNIYKLYNNGDLYGKGVKGKKLGTSLSDMEEINPNKWKVFEIPSEIPGDNTNRKVLPGYDCMFIVDKDNKLWGWGSNNYNKFGLTEEEQIEYTEVKPTKLDVDGKDVSKVFSLSNQTFVVTTDNELYAAGLNTYGQIGIGYSSSENGLFKKVDFLNPKEILNITCDSQYQTGIMILTSKNGVYFSGKISNSLYNSYSKNGCVTNFINVYDGKIGQNIGKNLINLISVDQYYFYSLDSEGNVYRLRPEILECIKVDIGAEEGRVESIRGIGHIVLATKRINNNVHFYYMSQSEWGYNEDLDTNINNFSWDFFELNSSITKNVDLNEIKDIFIGKCCYLLMNDGTVYAKGLNSGFGEGLSSGNTPNEFRKIQEFSDLPLVDSFCAGKESSEFSSYSFVLLKGVDGKFYGIGNGSIMFREKKLEKDWVLVAKNVKKFNASSSATYDGLAYVDFNDDIWVMGNSAKMLGCCPEGEDYEIPTFTKLKDKISGAGVFESISGKVEDYAIAPYAFYIKTNDLDNNSLYVSGFTYAGTRALNIGVNEDKYVPTKILSNVENFNCEVAEAGSLAITNENGIRKLYAWGVNNWSCIGGVVSATPKEINLDGGNLENTLLFIGGQMGIIYDGNENLFLCGNVSYNPMIQNGVDKSLYSFTKYTLENYLNITESRKLKGVIRCGGLGNNLYQLEDYSVFGLGNKSYMGIGVSDGSCAVKPIPVETPEKFVDIVGGNSFYVAVTEDGKVYGTGTNVNGVLGRWKGAPRSSGRYRTAFEWVECPELEI